MYSRVTVSLVLALAGRWIAVQPYLLQFNFIYNNYVEWEAKKKSFESIIDVKIGAECNMMKWI